MPQFLPTPRCGESQRDSGLQPNGCPAEGQPWVKIGKPPQPQGGLRRLCSGHGATPSELNAAGTGDPRWLLRRDLGLEDEIPSGFSEGLVLLDGFGGTNCYRTQGRPLSPRSPHRGTVFLMSLRSSNLSNASRQRITTQIGARKVNKAERIGHALAKASCHELAGDLAGSMSGPRDIATNPKYLQGFGT